MSISTRVRKLLQLLAEVGTLISEQDGARAHFGATVRTALDERFSSRCIGRKGPINCPPPLES
jgi:hypothetical protein